MRNLHVKVVLCLLLLNVLCCVQVASAGEDHLVACEYDHGPCKLRDYKELWSGPYQQGLRLWFGRQVTLKCSFHVFTHRDHPQLTWIDASGTAVNENSKKPCFYAHNVAFLDADENLIASCGDALTNRSVGNIPESRDRIMHIPRGCHEAIAQYKTAYYESGAAMGTRAAEEQQSSDEAAVPEHRSAEKPLRINATHRQLFENLPKGVYAFTRDGHCELSSAPLSSKAKKLSDPPILLGDESTSQAKVYLRAADDSGPKIYYSMKNHSELPARQYIYLAFFDDNGCLIASTSLNCQTPSKAISPSVSVDGVSQANISALSTFLPMLLPRGHHKRITSYKMTMYVYHEELKSVE